MQPVPCTTPGAMPALMKSIPAGWFSMGCATGRDDERPVHRVWVDAFRLGACQVTNTEYASFVRTTRREQPAMWSDSNFADPRQPVVSVSWFDAVEYCQWLSTEFAEEYRLPTEAEWERAARGTIDSDKLYPWGDTTPEMLPNYARRWKLAPEPVGLYPPNEYGVFNLGDNVHEWCSDWYDAAYYSVSPKHNPPGAASGVRRASRGGSWRHQIKVTRTAARSSIPPGLKYADYGFRVASSLRVASQTTELHAEPDRDGG